MLVVTCIAVLLFRQHQRMCQRMYRRQGSGSERGAPGQQSAHVCTCSHVPHKDMSLLLSLLHWDEEVWLQDVEIIIDVKCY